MKYSVATLSAVVAVALAKPQFLNSSFQVQEGKPFTLQVSGCDAADPCTIVLQTGPNSNLKDVETVATGVTGASATVTLTNVPSGTYNFKITTQDGESNYGQQFSYQGTGTLAPTSGTATSTAASSTTGAPTTLATSTVTSTTASETTSTHSATHNSTTTAAPTTTAPSTTASQPASSTTTRAASTTTAPPSSGAERLSSPFALIAGFAIAIAYLS